MRNLVDRLNEAIENGLNEAIKPDEQVMIDNLREPQLKQFAKLVADNLDKEEEDILMALKALSDMNYKIAPSDFHDYTKGKVDWLALDAYGKTMLFDADKNEWIPEEDA